MVKSLAASKVYISCFVSERPHQQNLYRKKTRPQTSEAGAQPEFLLPRRGARASEGKHHNKWREEIVVPLKLEG